MTDIQPWVLVAHLVRPQGRTGEILADILTDFPERFSERRNFQALSPDGRASRPVELEQHWQHKGRIVLKFAGVDSISDAEAFRGFDLAIPRGERAPLEEDAYYVDDLIGCLLIDTAPSHPREVGIVAGVDRETSNTSLLVVRSMANGEELLIPFVKAWLGRVELEQRRIEMALPEGLLTINTPGTNEE